MVQFHLTGLAAEFQAQTAYRLALVPWSRTHIALHRLPLRNRFGLAPPSLVKFLGGLSEGVEIYWMLPVSQDGLTGCPRLVEIDSASIPAYIFVGLGALDISIVKCLRSYKFSRRSSCSLSIASESPSAVSSGSGYCSFLSIRGGHQIGSNAFIGRGDVGMGLHDDVILRSYLRSLTGVELGDRLISIAEVDLGGSGGIQVSPYGVRLAIGTLHEGILMVI